MVSELIQELERFLEDGKYAIIKLRHGMPCRARAIVVRMQGKPMFWVTLRDPEDEQFVWDRFQAQ